MKKLMQFQLAKDLEKKEQWLTTILNNLGDGFITTDKTGKIIFMNSVAEAITGWSSQAALGRNITEVIDIAHKPQPTVSEHPVVAVLDPHKPSRSVGHVVLIPRRSPEIDPEINLEVDIEYMVLSAKIGGKITGSVLTFRDISKQKYSETVLRQAKDELEQRVAARTAELSKMVIAEQMQRRRTEALQAAGAMVSSSLELAEVLECLLTELGKVISYHSASVFLVVDGQLRLAAGCGLQDLSVVGRLFPYNELAKSMEQTHQPLIVDDTLADRRYAQWGDNHHIRCWMGVPLIARKRFIGYFTLDHHQPGVYTEADTTLAMSFADHAAMAVENAQLYKGLQDQMDMLQEMQDQLIQSEKFAAIGQLSASIVHEVNNPLQAIQNALALLIEEVNGRQRPERLQGYFKIAEEEIQRISEITHRMHDFYRPAPDAVRTEELVALDAFYHLTKEDFTPIDLRATLESVLRLTAATLQSAQVTVACCFADDLPVIYGQADYLKQVFLNLVTNAADAMTGRGGMLNIDVGLDWVYSDTGEGGPGVSLQFSDTGPGIPQEILLRVFDPFFSTKAHGLGLGLSITQKIVNAHNGQIRVESHLGLGTTFTILLPLNNQV